MVQQLSTYPLRSLGAQPPTASWGGMLSRSAQFLTVAPSVQVFAPGLTITLTVLAINALGDSLRDSLDPVAGTERRVRRSLARAAKDRAKEQQATMATTTKRAS